VLEDGRTVEKIFYCLLVVHCCVLMRRTLLVDVRLSEAILVKKLVRGNACKKLLQSAI
jgi:hypothetical protein